MRIAEKGDILPVKEKSFGILWTATMDDIGEYERSQYLQIHIGS